MAKRDQDMRREESLFTRLTKQEKAIVRKRAKAVGLFMDEYNRCKLFDIPFEHISGRFKDKPAAESHTETPAATESTA